MRIPTCLLAMALCLLMRCGRSGGGADIERAVESRTHNVLTVITQQGDIEIELTSEKAMAKLVSQMVALAERGGYDGCRLDKWGEDRIHIYFNDEGSPGFVRVAAPKGQSNIMSKLEKGQVALMEEFNRTDLVCIDHLVIGLGRDNYYDHNPALPVVGRVTSGMSILDAYQERLTGIRIRTGQSGPSSREDDVVHGSDRRTPPGAYDAGGRAYAQGNCTDGANGARSTAPLEDSYCNQGDLSNAGDIDVRVVSSDLRKERFLSGSTDYIGWVLRVKAQITNCSDGVLRLPLPEPFRLSFVNASDYPCDEQLWWRSEQGGFADIPPSATVERYFEFWVTDYSSLYARLGVRKVHRLDDTSVQFQNAMLYVNLGQLPDVSRVR